MTPGRLPRVRDLPARLSKLFTKPAKPAAGSRLLERFVLDEVRAALDRSGAAAAERALLEHYAGRIGRGWLEPPRRITDLRLDLGALGRDELIDRAERILDYDLHPSGIRPRVDATGSIDWAHNCAHSREWLLMLNRHAWWPVLGKAYQASGDERYAQAFVSQLLDWIERCPPIAAKDERNPHWRLMETGLRMRISWLPSFGLFFRSPHFTEDVKLRFLGSVYDHAAFLERFKTNRNHLLRESNGLLCVALWLPELAEAANWKALALQRLDQELREQINDDGSQIELSSGYQWLAIDEFEITFDLLQWGSEAPYRERLDQRLRSMYEFLAFLLRPDGTFPQINDGVLLWSRERIVESAQRRGQAELEYIGSLGASGTMPAITSRAFENAGLFAMRSDWTRRANWLLFDAGPYGGPHGHEDKLSLEVTALGMPMIVDPGFYTYQKDDPFRDYFVSSRAHNTVLVDGYGQVRRWQGEHMIPRTEGPAEALWRSEEHFDFVSASYRDGYGTVSATREASGPVVLRGVHRRHVLFVKPRYWCVFDEVRIDEGEHVFEHLFQIGPDVNVSVAGDRVCLTRGDIQMQILSIGAAQPTVSCHWGETDPPSGWYSPDSFKKVPATTLRLSRNVVGPLRTVTMLLPRRADEGAMQIILPAGGVAEGWPRFELETPFGRDRFAVEPAVGGAACKLVCERRGADGRVSACLEQDLGD